MAPLHNLKKSTTLPADPSAALQHMIRVSQSLITVAEKQTQALLLSDTLAFSILQFEQDKLAIQYAEISAAFRARLEEFRGTDPKMLDHLVMLQKDLANISSANNALVERKYAAAHNNVSNSLESSNAAAETRRVRFARTPIATTAASEGVTT